MQNKLKKLGLLILCFFIISACTKAKAPAQEPSAKDTTQEETPKNEVKTVAHTDLNFEDIVYERPDTDSLNQKIDALMELIPTKKKQKEVLDAYADIMNDSTNLDTMYSLANLYHDINLSDPYYKEESQFINDYYTTFDNKMLALTKTMLESEYADAFRNVWGEDFIQRYEGNAKLNSPEIEELSKQETALIQAYQTALTAGYTVNYDGVDYLLNELDPNDEGYVDAFYIIYAQKNEACGEIYRQLVDIRTQIAEKLGYQSYTDYRYDILGYGFTKEESAQLHENVRTELVPLYQQLEALYDSETKQAAARNMISANDGLPYLEQALSNEFPSRMSEAYTYMVSHNLYYFNNDQNMMRSAFSTFLSGYRAPFLFMNTDSHKNVSTLFHEFGHYSNFYTAQPTAWNQGQDLNLAEVHSQGLELLMHTYYSDMYGEDAQIMQYYSIMDILGNILQGCAEDEFQQRVYENPTMSLEELNTLHEEIYASYLGTSIYYQWVDISHNFEQPLYYISYATSAISALEIWSDAQKDRKEAIRLYEEVSNYCFNIKYLDVLQKVGLSNPFTSDIVSNIRQEIMHFTGLQLN